MIFTFKRNSKTDYSCGYADNFYHDFTAEHPEEDENDIEAKIAEADAAINNERKAGNK